MRLIREKGLGRGLVVRGNKNLDQIARVNNFQHTLVCYCPSIAGKAGNVVTKNLGGRIVRHQFRRRISKILSKENLRLWVGVRCINRC